MRKLILVAALAASISSFAQEKPYGFDMNEADFQQLPCLTLETFDQSLLLAEAEQMERETGRTKNGRIITTDLNEHNSGTWSELANGDRLWQLRFRTAGAIGVSVYYRDLYIPDGAYMFIYSIDRHYFLGPFTNTDCKEHGHFMMGEVFGDEAVIELYVPAGVITEPRIGIRGIAHLFRYVYDYRDVEGGGESLSCEVDVNCPEGSDWQKERDAVVRLAFPSGNATFLCSGSLVNTTAKDCRKYILSAMHCVEELAESELQECSVLFNFQRTNCGTGTASAIHTKVGVTRLADSNDGGGQLGSDFLLLEMDETTIPTQWHPYFAGWNAGTTTPEEVVGIHHPAGDSKKISYATNVVTGTYNAPGFHWQVKWQATDTGWGVTEGGSSGSPIFDQDHFIVGTLTGGYSCCTVGGCDPTELTGPNEPDWYGKMNKHWTANPNLPSQKLKVWLDPLNTGATTLQGSYVNTTLALPCSDFPAGINELSFDAIKIFPSIADDELTVQVARYKEIEDVRIYSSAGTLVESTRLSAAQQNIGLTGYANGLYYITFILDSGNHITKKFIVGH